MVIELVPILIPPEHNKFSIAEQEMSEIVAMTIEYYGKVGYNPPWIGYVAVQGEEIVGSAGFKGQPVNGKVEIAYGTATNWRNSGIGTEICRLMTRLALTADPNVRVTARTLEKNNASGKILVKNGFKLLGKVHDDEDGEVLEWQYVK
jgi:RimJ/RimL family protein N-acetyltransferase